jgi:nucleoside-diphosphate-sugar epimerase
MKVRTCRSPTIPVRSAGRNKRFGETLCVVYAKQEGIPVRMPRPFNNYGPGLKITEGRVIPDFAKDIFAGRDIIMLSDGKPKRTFCYATDAITVSFGVERLQSAPRDLADAVCSRLNEGD